MRVIGERAERRAHQQHVVDLAQQVLRGRVVGHRPEDLRELQSDAHREERQHVRARRPGAHRPRQLAVRLVQVTACTASRAAAANASTAVA